MKRFLLSPKFLLPLLILLLIEAVFRLGVWEAYVLKDSYAGRSYLAKKSLLEEDRPVSWVSLGDSRTVQGFHHLTLRKLPQGRSVLSRLALPGSHLATLQSAGDWAHRTVPELEGIVLALAPRSLLSTNNGAYEQQLARPFHGLFSTGLNWQPADNDDLLTRLTEYSALLGYRKDIADAMIYPSKRLFDWQRPDRVPVFRRYLTKHAGNLCGAPINTPQQCVDIADARHSRISNKARNTLRQHCGTPERIRYYDGNEAQRQEDLQHWHAMIEQWLMAGLKVRLVRLPQHPVIPQLTDGADSKSWAQLVQRLSSYDGFREIDLSSALGSDHQSMCHYLHDFVHTNRTGAKKLTQALTQNW